jgi:hypothetical protein
VSENRVLRKIFGPQGDEVTGEWRNLRNEEVYAVYSLTKYQMRKKERGGSMWHVW